MLQTGHPAPHLMWATAAIKRCGSNTAAAANSAALSRLRMATGSSEQDLEQVWNQLQYVRDAGVYRVAVEIAADKSASEPARVDAFLWLLRLRRPQQVVTVADVGGGFDEKGLVRGGCGRFTRSGGPLPREEWQPIPSGFDSEIAELGERISEDTTEPLNVRTAARCAATFGWQPHP